MKSWITLSKSGHYSVTVQVEGRSRNTIARKIGTLAEARQILEKFKQHQQEEAFKHERSNERTMSLLEQIAKEAGWDEQTCGLVAFIHSKLMDCREHDEELGRWQQEIYEAIKKHSGADSEIDGAGCDSGDPLDLTLTEIAQGFSYLDNLLFETMESVSHSEVEGSTFQAAADLIKQLAAENLELSQNTCSECGPENYGWIFNRVEGRAACGCMTEAEPFQILLKALEQIADPHGPQSGVACAMVAKEALRAVLSLNYSSE